MRISTEAKAKRGSRGGLVIGVFVAALAVLSLPVRGDAQVIQAEAPSLEAMGPKLKDWQKEFVLERLANPARYGYFGVGGQRWAGLDAKGRESHVMTALIEETQRRRKREMDRLMNLYRTRFYSQREAPSGEMIRFAEDVLTFEERFPYGKPAGESDSGMVNLQRRAAQIQSDDYYRFVRRIEVDLSEKLNAPDLDPIFDDFKSAPIGSVEGAAKEPAFEFSLEGRPESAALFDTLLAKMDTDTEIRLLAELREAQGRFKEMQSARIKSDKESAEVIVAVVDLSSGVSAQVSWDPGPDLDGKRHVRLEFDRKIFNPEGIDDPDLRITTAHELTHIIDFLAQKRPSQRFLEPRAFLNGARVYRDMGFPENSGSWNNYHKFCDDAVGWMHSQIDLYAGNISNYYLWRNITGDDLERPDLGLDWRLQYAYQFVARFSSQDGKTRAEMAAEAGEKIGLDEEASSRLLAVWEDESLSEWNKPFIFAERAASAPFAEKWIEDVKEMSGVWRSEIREDQKRFWKDLGAFQRGER